MPIGVFSGDIFTPVRYHANMRYGRVLAFTSALAGNLFLVWLFLRALMSPLDHIAFIHQVAFLIIVEGAGIQVAFQLNEIRAGRIEPGTTSSPFWAAVLFSGLVIGLGYAYGNYAIPLIFAISTAAKVLGYKAAPPESRLIARLPFLILVASVPLMFLLTPFFQSRFPFPPEFFTYKVEGVLEGMARVLPYSVYPNLVWGLIYFSLIAALEAVLFLRKKR